ncbi:flagellar basal body rod protein FlgC [Geobacter sulfurreducens]|mgnify:CR=1 FL=1|jgi:flagellar basal-body rod protein FlgC|uniref:Flagellar basal-body rod protein FlgC n=1 Tax=Geobacter sulfurreducens (strain ATCC 51573 / DSM 12127 / PCA) TaxID=243231 RepID=Q74G41_GEOSL|nr:flagellar basal body rod protein FlgC [Geobacter sulfurreducens]AAR33740.1 flagellar basal body rod protein FlgC [Geobacter sulfurreducens PCA]ADI83239.1 flagellar basal body rod protein FlgC [Geobacter sulfurreducens KN400]AJY70132.1 flagellar basal body rod protein FlgC [Geobacter sulfurreducens]QVW35665.1 flagellar basal body rod protein FlgC [Geobacter sulfurreducens]UAC04489.1 flagellar basal body rod protein FlgC [Geobacter sulfurreducens]
MDFFSAMQVSSSALSAERTRMNLISANLANANSTRTAEGGPYKRKDAVFAATQVGEGFRSALDRMRKNAPQGVQVTGIVEDPNPPRLQYDPSHPDADAKGYVALPNVNVVEEMADMIAATRAYEANVTAMQAAKNMALKTLEIGSR